MQAIEKLIRKSVQQLPSGLVRQRRDAVLATQLAEGLELIGGQQTEQNEKGKLKKYF